MEIQTYQGHGQRAQGIHQLNDLCCGLKGLLDKGVFSEKQVLLSLTLCTGTKALEVPAAALLHLDGTLCQGGSGLPTVISESR